jgi:flagellar hook-associated protein 1
VAAQLSALAHAPLGAASSPSAAYGNWSGDIGLRKSQASNDATLRAGTTAQLASLNQSASGVSIEEEMVNMQQFQRAFEASTKVMQTADQLLNDLMQIAP